MSGVEALDARSPREVARAGLIVALHELGEAAGELQIYAFGVNDEDHGKLTGGALGLVAKLLAVHLPEPDDRVTRALDGIIHAVHNIRMPPKDESLQFRTTSRVKVRGLVGGLRTAVDDALGAARSAFPNGEAIPKRTRQIAAEIDKAQVKELLTELDILEARLDEVAAEADAAPEFARQGEIVTFYVRDMSFQIDLARFHLKVNKVSLDIGALLDAVESARDVSERFQATVRAWFGRVTKSLTRHTNNLMAAMRRLITGVRTLAGMVTVAAPIKPESGPEMVLIQPGPFIMGIPEAESKREKTEELDGRARPQQPVNIRNPFLLGKYPVTRGEYAEFARETKRKWEPPSFKQTDRHPAVNVSSENAVAYADWLSRRTGHSYRLPSEAEWEYACRAGTRTARYWGDGPGRKLANFGRKATTEVGAFRPNPWGLHDMLGNVWEWVADPWHRNYDDAPGDGSVWKSGGNAGSRVLRGGSWNSDGGNCRAGYRVRGNAGNRDNNAGFRLARTP